MLFLVNRHSSLLMGIGTEELRNALCLYYSLQSPSLLKNSQPSQRNYTFFPFTSVERSASSASIGETDSYPNDEDSGPDGSSYTGSGSSHCGSKPQSRCRNCHRD